MLMATESPDSAWGDHRLLWKVRLTAHPAPGDGGPMSCRIPEDTVLTDLETWCAWESAPPMSLAIKFGSKGGIFTNWAIWGPLNLHSAVFIRDTEKMSLSFHKCWCLKIDFAQMRLNKQISDEINDILVMIWAIKLAPLESIPELLVSQANKVLYFAEAKLSWVFAHLQQKPHPKWLTVIDTSHTCYWSGLLPKT